MKKKIITDSLIINIANLTSQGLSILQGFIILRFIDPDSYGAWLGLLILLRYGAYANLGLEYGLVFRMPYYIGQKNETHIRQVEDSTFIGWTILTVLFASGVLGYYLLIPQSSRIFVFGIQIISLMLIAEQQSAFLARWHSNGHKDFKSFSYISILKGIISFMIIVPLAYFFQVKGLMVGNLAVSGLTAVIWWLRTPYRSHGQLSLVILKDLFRVGFPSLLVVVGGVLIETVDRILILNLLGAVNLGYYAITSIGGNSLYGLLAQAGSVMVPHMVEESGEHEDNYTVFEKFMVKPTVYLAYLSMFMITGLVFVIPVLVKLWLPKYIPGISAFYLFVPGFYFLSIIIIANNILNVIFISQRRQFWLVIIQFLAVIVEAAFGLLYIRLGWGIAGVALASTLSYMAYGLTVLTLSSGFVFQDRRARARFVQEVFTPFFYGGVLILGLLNLKRLAFSESPILLGACQLVLSIIFYAPLILRLNRKYSLVSDINYFPFLSPLKNFLGKK